MSLPWYDDNRHPHGPPLVLLHAFPLSSVVHERLERQLDGARVVRVDLPGLGRSADAATGEPSVAAMADAVAGVLDETGISRAAVLGVSTGGYVALELAARHADRVAALALGSTTTRVGPPDDPDERRRLADELESSGDLGPLVDGARAGLGRTALREQADLLSLLQDVVRSQDPTGVAWVARAIAGRRDTTTVLADFPGPVLLLCGSEDRETPPARAAEMAAARGGRRTRVVELPATGHLTVLERPLQSAAALLDLVAETRAGEKGTARPPRG